MSTKPSIKILISCHKPVCCPTGEVFLPVHVGSSGKIPIAGCQRDDEGQNISDRNFTFCEMTGQYWAWKNLEADYVGQCHYRRYFSFDDEKHEPNDHGQIEESCLSQFTIRSYAIDDEKAIRRALEEADLLRAPYWCVKGVPTPCGPKKSVREHMSAYGLVTAQEFDRLVELCREVQPDYADELEAYLNGDEYLGYNCFVMKRPLFDRLCEFEFSVLCRFDDEYDYSNKTMTHKRICGYLGEVLFSAFVARIAKEGARIAERPMVFFENTPAPLSLPISADSSCNVIWRYIESNPAKLAIAITSLIHAMREGERCRLTLIHDASLNIVQLRRYLGPLPDSFELVDATFPAIALGDCGIHLNETEAHILLPFLLPNMAKRGTRLSGRVLWIEGCALFQDSPCKIVENQGASFQAVRSVYLEKELNKPSNCGLVDVSRSGSSGSHALEASCLVIDLGAEAPSGCDLLSMYRSACSSLSIDPSGEFKVEFAKYEIHKRRPGTAKDSFCMPLSVYIVRDRLLHMVGASTLPLESAYSVVCEDELRSWANEETVREFLAVKDSGVFLYHPESTPFLKPDSEKSFAFWCLARRTPAYEPLLVALTEYRPLGLKRMLFPEGTKRFRIAATLATKFRAFL